MAKFLTKADLTLIDKTIYKVKKEELKTRTLFPMKIDSTPWASSAEHKISQGHGEATVRAVGETGANDSKTVGESLDVKSVPIYRIDASIVITGHEMEQMDRARSLGQPYNLDMERNEMARRLNYEKETALTFTTDTGLNIKGVFDTTFYGASASLGLEEDVPTGVGGFLWSQKTALEIVVDLARAITVVRQNGTYSGTIKVIVTYVNFQILKDPFAADPTFTIFDYMKKNYPDVIIDYTSAIDSAHTGYGEDVIFAYAFDMSILRLRVPLDITRGPVTAPNEYGDIKYIVKEHFAGAEAIQPQFMYVGKGI